MLRGGYGVFYNLFDRVGSEDQLALNLPGLINNSLSTSSTTTPLFLLKDGFPAELPRPGPSSTDRRHLRLRAADQDASKTTMHQSSVGAQQGVRGLLGALARPRLASKGTNLAYLINLNQPCPTRPATTRWRPALPQLRLHRVARSRTRPRATRAWTSGSRRRFTSGWGFEPRLHARRLAATRAPSTSPRGGSPSFPQDARELRGLGRAVRLRHAAPLRR